jgi:Flp pilus assembly protein TadD
MPSAKIYTAVLSCITAFILCACNTQPVKSNLNSSGDNTGNILNLLDPSVTTEAEAFAKGEAALAEGKTDNALFYYVKTLQYNKKNIKALEKIAVIHSLGKHPELARKVYQDILSLDNTHPMANEYLGLYLLENGNTAQAKSYLTQAVKHGNRQWKSHNGLGVIADLEHNSAEGIAHYEAAAAIEPTNPMILNNVGYSYYLAGEDTKAKHFFNQALSFDSKYKRAIHNLALIEIKRGAFPAAIALFNRIMSPHEAFNNTGYICMLNGQYDVAEEYFQRAIDESPVYFPKAQENMDTLLTLKKTRGPYQAPTEEPYQIESPPEIEPTVSSVHPESLKPELQAQKVEKTETPAAQRNKKSALIKKEGSQTGKPKQLAAKTDKKKNRPEAGQVAKSEASERGIGKTKAVNQKIEKLPAISTAEQKNRDAKPPVQLVQEVNNKTANGNIAAAPKPEVVKPAPSTKPPEPIEQAKAAELPKPSPAALPDSNKPSAQTLPANAKANLPAQVENTLPSEKAAPVISKAAEAKPEASPESETPIEQKKVPPAPKTNAATPAIAEAPAEPKPANSPGLQENMSIQKAKASMPPSDIGNAQQPAANSEVKTQPQPSFKSDAVVNQVNMASKSKELAETLSPILPVKKNDTFVSDITANNQK